MWWSVNRVHCIIYPDYVIYSVKTIVNIEYISRGKLYIMHLNFKANNDHWIIYVLHIWSILDYLLVSFVYSSMFN